MWASVLIALAVVCLAALFYGLHRLATWAEDRGWIYYRKGRGSSGSGARAMLELQSLAHPATRHVIEERRRSELERVDDESSSGDHGRAVRPADRADCSGTDDPSPTGQTRVHL